MELKEVVASNVSMLAEAEGYSTNALARKCGMAQKTVWSIMDGQHAARLDNVEALAKGLGVSPALLMTEGLSLSALKSIKSPRMMAEYLSLPAIQRARVDAMVKSLQRPILESPVSQPAELQAVMGF